MLLKLAAFPGPKQFITYHILWMDGRRILDPSNPPVIWITRRKPIATKRRHGTKAKN
jgi:hypothetical protein